MNTLIQLYVKTYYKKLYEGINFSDLDDSSNDDMEFNNILGNLTAILLKSYYTNKLNEILKIPRLVKREYTEVFKELYQVYKNANIPLYIVNEDSLFKVIRKHMAIFGTKCDLNWIDTSLVTNMKLLFGSIDTRAFDGDISLWDVSNVTNMSYMFHNSNFDGDISLWNVIHVTDMSYMFHWSEFSGDISNWDVSNVTDMNRMFMYAKNFRCNISSWKINKSCDVCDMFIGCPLEDTYYNSYIPKSINESILIEGINFSDLDDSSDEFNNVLSDLTYSLLKKYYTLKLNKAYLNNTSQDYYDEYKNIFDELYKAYTTLNKPLYVAGIVDLRELIGHHIGLYSYNCDLNWIDTSLVTNMSCLFDGSPFNGDISNWNVSNVTDMSCMFYDSKFNGDISNWNVSNVTNMSFMFLNSTFNQNINGWNVFNVISMEGMFINAVFNLDISNWKVYNVTNMCEMFSGSNFNLDISNWKVFNVENMGGMFANCAIMLDLHNFIIPETAYIWNMFKGTNMPNDYLPLLYKTYNI